MFDNIKNVPKYLYRVELVPPKIAFIDGLKPLGTNDNFFEHISGHSLNRKLGVDRRSAFISLTETREAALRIFGLVNNNIETVKHYYIYKIRANSNTYSVLRTANFYLSKIKNRSLNFKNGDYVYTNEIIEFIYKYLSHQREWINLGVIEPTRIVEAKKINLHEIANEFVYKNNESLKYYLQPSKKSVPNMGYLNRKSLANFLPYKWSKEKEYETTSVQNTIFYLDTYGGVQTSLSIATTLDANKSIVGKNKSQYDVIYSGFGHTLIDKVLLNEPINQGFDLGEYKYSKPHYSLISIKSLENGDKNYWVTWDKQDRKFACCLIDEAKINEAAQFIYDDYGRISLKQSENKLSFCLTLQKFEKGIYEVQFKIATINNPFQEFVFEQVEYKGKQNLFKIKSRVLNGLTLHRRKNDSLNNLFMLEPDTCGDRFEEVYVEIDKTKTLSQILLPQKSNSQLIDLKLRWRYAQQFFVPVPETGFSKLNIPYERKFFYDLNTFKIVYINKNNDIFCLYNKRYQYSSKWDWVRWQPGDLEETREDRLKWYFDYFHMCQNTTQSACRTIKSFSNNDVLKVFIKGVNWGSLYTSNTSNQSNSSNEFSLDINSLI